MEYCALPSIFEINQINQIMMKRKRLFALLATVLLAVFAISFFARGETRYSVPDHEMRPVAYFEMPINEDEYEIINCCLHIPHRSCELLSQDPRCGIDP